ncbi:3-deoxy-D-manno-octulosonic acid transferase [Thiohalorhabdus methylotrophus]|uniref:3-deoxy-D-manno-octulosonic acid transferase n=1 Tax=Thiohalorhabdus methylotrophus TaxID=3242694 RepID=A0ABV4TTV2_9GAMM
MKVSAYNVLVRLAALPAVGYTLWRANRDGGGRYFRQRLGRDAPEGPFDYWLHCASVGEVRAAAPLVRALAEGTASLLVSTATPTGADAAEKAFPEGVVHAYLPLDLPGGVRRFLDQACPRQALVVETELWPNLFAACERRGIPLTIVNGRLSPRTMEAPAWLRRAYRTALRSVAECLARSEEDAERFRGLGMPDQRIRVLGNLKFAQMADLQREAEVDRLLERPYVLAGSTREGEEAMLSRLWKRVGDAERLLVIAPRHPERREAILRELAEVTEKVAVRSRGEPVARDTEVYLADTLGELTGFMAHADLVFLGGSLVPKGGHNLLEPAALGKLVVVGPYMENFAEETRLLLEGGGAVQVADEAELEVALDRLLASPEARERIGGAARATVTANSGVLADYVAAVTGSRETIGQSS